MKERLQEKARERHQNLSDEEKTKSENMVLNDIKTFLEKNKTKSINMLVKDIEIFQKIQNKG